MIAALRDEKELIVLQCNTIRELLVTLKDIFKKAVEKEEFIKKKMKKTDMVKKKDQEYLPFSICEQVLLYADIVVYTAKENPERISYRPSKYVKNEVISA